jgi:chaperonin cofactor prefoldin
MPDEKPMPETLETLATRVTALDKSVEQRFAKMKAEMDARFEDVDTALVEQREYTELAFSQLKTEMKDLRGEMTGMRGEMTGMRGEMTGMRGEMTGMRGGFGRLERKLDNVLNMRTRTPKRRRGGR